MKLPTNQKGIKAALKTLCMVMLALTVSFSVSAQINISGTVTEASGLGLPGVSVVVSGTTTGVLTNMDGTYTLTVPNASSVIQYSFIGYLSQEIVVGSQRTINVVLAEDVQQLDEVVVVGYGTQAKKDITGSVSVVTSETLAESASATFAQALQGKSAGVYVSTTGAPGAAATIRVRGVGSVNGSDPLVIIDGVSGGRIDAVNSNDIETFQILKDASATAIYGAQGANGVIIITTKQGTKSGQARVTYNGYVGVSTMANDGYDVLTAWEMMEFAAEGMINRQNYRGIKATGDTQFGTLQNIDYDESVIVGYEDAAHTIPLYYINSANMTMPFTTLPAGSSYNQILTTMGGTVTGDAETDMNAAYEILKAKYGTSGSANSYALSAYYYNILEGGMTTEEAKVGNDWYDLIVQDGLIQDHQLSVIGGNDKGQYSFSFAYTGQEGTIKNSLFDRYSVRLNSTFNPRKHISVGINSNISFTETSGDRGDQGDGSPFAQTYTTKSWVAPYNVSGTYAGTWNDGGRSNTPLASVDGGLNDWDRNINVQNSAFIEIKPIEGLTIKSQVAATINGRWQRTFNERSIEWNKEGSTYNSLSETASYSLNTQWTNTANYTKKIGSNNITVLLGTEALDQDYGREINATRREYLYPDDPNTWVINNGVTANLSNSGTQRSHTAMFGYFLRADYNWDGKYLATLAVRRDASSKFSDKNRWGTFPSLSLGWRVSDESFMDGTKAWLDDFKLRAGYGTSGNSNIGAYNWATQYATGTNYHYAINGTDNTLATGYAVSTLGDFDSRWETTKMTNFAFDATLFDSKMTLTVEYYIKKTSDMLVSASTVWSDLAGSATKPDVNVGDMKNTGIEVNLGWNDKIGKFSYGATLNISQYKNEVIKLGATDLLTSTRIDNVTITTPGQPIGMYYGYKITGIYQNADDVLNYTNSEGEQVLPYLQNDPAGFTPISYVGRWKIEDFNNDGFTNQLDQQIIGNPHPDFTGGLNITAGYGNWDLSSYLYFSVGNDLYKQYMNYTHYGSLGSNYVQDRRDNSWSNENPDGIYPLWTGAASEASETSSLSNNLYVQDGSYARMQNFQIGYKLPNSLIDKLGVSNFRIYGQISNLFTITKYDGLDPEVRSSNDRNKGIDYGGYGIPRNYIFGVNIAF